MAIRPVTEIIEGEMVSDGAGVRLRRTIGGRRKLNLDPFLLLDEFYSDNPKDYIAGFPPHPHRGFETVTYMLAGRMRHRDNAGHEGVIEPLGAQWMTAGRGIVHSEMPEQQEGLLRGLQLWVNLPADRKMTAPRYQEVDAADVPLIETDGGTVRLLAGHFKDMEGAIKGIDVAPLYIDVTLAGGGEFQTALPTDHTAFIYVLDGSLRMPHATWEVISAGHLAILSDGDAVDVSADEQGARFVLVAGAPLNEPIVRHGPFVMSSKREIEDAIRDFRSGRLGG